jgi:hypothetical protein
MNIPLHDDHHRCPTANRMDAHRFKMTPGMQVWPESTSGLYGNGIFAIARAVGVS